MKRCNDCNRINPAEEVFCLTCGSASLEPVGDELPFVRDETKRKTNKS